MKSLAHVELVLFSVFTIAFLVWFSWPLLGAASQNIRLVSTFQVDEGIYARWVAGLLDQHTFHIARQDQGHLYIYMAFLPLLLLSQLTSVSEQTIIVTLRLVSLATGIGTVIVVFLFARHCFGRTAG